MQFSIRFFSDDDALKHGGHRYADLYFDTATEAPARMLALVRAGANGMSLCCAARNFLQYDPQKDPAFSFLPWSHFYLGEPDEEWVSLSSAYAQMRYLLDAAHVLRGAMTRLK